jgi:hypothetical protein
VLTQIWLFCGAEHVAFALRSLPSLLGGLEWTLHDANTPALSSSRLTLGDQMAALVGRLPLPPTPLSPLPGAAALATSAKTAVASSHTAKAAAAGSDTMAESKGDAKRGATTAQAFAIAQIVFTDLLKGCASTVASRSDLIRCRSGVYPRILHSSSLRQGYAHCRHVCA